MTGTNTSAENLRAGDVWKRAEDDWVSVTKTRQVPGTNGNTRKVWFVDENGLEGSVEIESYTPVVVFV